MWMGRPEEGLPDIEEALALERILGRPEGEAHCLRGQSEVLATLGKVEEARNIAEQAIEIARRVGHREWTTTALGALGFAYEAAGDLDAAEAAYRESLEMGRDMPIMVLTASRLASVLARKGDLDSAEAYLSLVGGWDWEPWRLEAALVKAEIANLRGDPDAQAIAAEALARAEARGIANPTYSRVKRLIGSSIDAGRLHPGEGGSAIPFC